MNRRAFEGQRYEKNAQIKQKCANFLHNFKRNVTFAQLFGKSIKIIITLYKKQ